MKAVTAEDEARFKKLLGKPKTSSGSLRAMSEQEKQELAKLLLLSQRILDRRN